MAEFALMFVFKQIEKWLSPLYVRVPYVRFWVSLPLWLFFLVESLACQAVWCCRSKFNQVWLVWYSVQEVKLFYGVQGSFPLSFLYSPVVHGTDVDSQHLWYITFIFPTASLFVSGISLHSQPSLSILNKRNSFCRLGTRSASFSSCMLWCVCRMCILMRIN